MFRILSFTIGLTAAVVGVAGYLGLPTAATAPAAAHQAPAFDSARAWTHLEAMLAIGPRPAGSDGIVKTRAYITAQMREAGITVEEQAFTMDTPAGPIEFVNLIARLEGEQPGKILLTGHYDTKPFDEFTFLGANDGGSSAAFLIELARVLKDRPRQYTWEFVWFDGEEAFCFDWYECGTLGAPDNTYGSRHYVKAAQDAGTLDSIGAMILVDMIGERGARFLRESDSTDWLKDIIWSTAAELGHGGTFLNPETPITDDHKPFLDAGVPAVDIIDIDYTSWHTAADTIDKLSARSMEIVGEVLIASLPKVEAHLQANRQ